MDKGKLYQNSLKYFNIFFAILLVFWLVSSIELAINVAPVNDNKKLIYSFIFRFLNDFWLLFIASFALVPLYLWATISERKILIGIVHFLVLVLLLIQVSLTGYTLETKVNLGSDLLGYTLDDIFLTISSSISIFSIQVIGIFLIPVLFYLLVFFFRKINKQKIFFYLTLFLLISTICVKLFFKQIHDVTHKSKIQFLIADINTTFTNKNLTYNNVNPYPFLNPSNKNEDVLGNFFTLNPNKKPNICILIIEGLGTEFINDNEYSGFTPFIDQLSKQSLYWKNFISTSGRTFGVLPSITASLPFGNMGFLELKTIPTHYSLFTELQKNGYTSTYITGTRSSFDNIYRYLEHNKVNKIIDEFKFSKDYQKVQKDKNGFSWGYPDDQIFKRFLSTLGSDNLRFDVISTLSNHEPFEIPNKSKYLNKVDSLINQKSSIKAPKKIVSKYKEIFATLLYVDESLQAFIKAYKQYPEFNNTIFIISGDHRLIPVEQKNEICRYHVPLFIYSPMLKYNKTFEGISSHFDITPTVLNFLNANYDIALEKKYAWIGSNLNTTNAFSTSKEIPLMRYKGNLKDYVYQHFFLSDESLFKIENHLKLKEINNKALKRKLKSKLDSFISINLYATSKNKLIPRDKEDNLIKTKSISKEEQKLLIKITTGKTTDELFIMARDSAINGNRKLARLLCDFALETNPDYPDFRVLKGRTFAWDGAYDLAEQQLLESINKSPYYYDTYSALLDVYIWSEQTDKGIELAKKAVINKIDNPEISFKLAKLYLQKQKNTYAKRIIDSLLRIYPTNNEFLRFKKTIP